MTPDVEVPDQDISRVARADVRLFEAISSLSDNDVARPSALPDWTVGHVLAHLARNADSHIRRARAAVTGDFVEQYPGGVEGRAAEIEDGARRSAAVIIDDVRVTADALQNVWPEVPALAWDQVSRDVGGTVRTLRELPGRRWQELEVHMVDLGIGITYRDWPEDFVEVSLARLRPGAAGRVAGGSALPAPGVLDSREELAWLFCRLTRPDLPALSQW